MDIRDTILARLRNGENAIDIANEYADMLNDAVAEYEAELAAKRKAEEEAAARKAERKTAIADLTTAFNGFFDTIFPSGYCGITEDMVSSVMDLVTSAFDKGASGYSITSHSETGKKPVTKVTIHNDVDGKIAKFLEKNGLK